MANTCPKSQFFPRNRRLTVGEQMDLDEHSRQMFAFMQNKIEDEKLNALREEVRVEEKKFFKAMRKQKKALKRAARASSRDSGYSSGSCSRQEVPHGFVRNPFYQGPPTAPSSEVVSPTGVPLVPNPFYTGPTPSPPAIFQPVKLVVNPFYDPNYVSK